MCNWDVKDQKLHRIVKGKQRGNCAEGYRCDGVVGDKRPTRVEDDERRDALDLHTGTHDRGLAACTAMVGRTRQAQVAVGGRQRMRGLD
jgi:hypothetical protein